MIHTCRRLRATTAASRPRATQRSSQNQYGRAMLQASLSVPSLVRSIVGLLSWRRLSAGYSATVASIRDGTLGKQNAGRAPLAGAASGNDDSMARHAAPE